METKHLSDSDIFLKFWNELSDKYCKSDIYEFYSCLVLF
jgi:hypothetical protein